MANVCLLVLIATQVYISLSLEQKLSEEELTQVPRDLPLVKRLATESALTEAEKLAFLAIHNELRGQTDPPAANMEYMQWDDSLATYAQRWSDECIWAHGFPDENITPFDPVGQNLWSGWPVSETDRPNPETIVQSFFNEKDHYNLDTHKCEEGYDCGHYTQVVWHNSYALGCGMTFCPTATGIEGSNILLITCHYGQPGNYAGARPYVSGTPCTKCSSGIGQCYENKCRKCSDHSGECVCAQVCENCSELDAEQCKCNCFWGYYQADCSAKCIDDQKCGNEWPFSWCDTTPYVKQNCPATCDVCFEYLPQFFKCETDLSN